MILEIRGIDTYYGLGHILHGLSLRVDEGEVVALLGRNGAGKTTTLRSITGLTPPRSGAIKVAFVLSEGATVIRLWYVRESSAAVLYTTVPPERHPGELEEVWVPKSIIEHRTKRDREHLVTLPCWFIERKGL